MDLLHKILLSMHHDDHSSSRKSNLNKLSKKENKSIISNKGSYKANFYSTNMQIMYKLYRKQDKFKDFLWWDVTMKFCKLTICWEVFKERLYNLHDKVYIHTLSQNISSWLELNFVAKQKLSFWTSRCGGNPTYLIFDH